MSETMINTCEVHGVVGCVSCNSHLVVGRIEFGQKGPYFSRDDVPSIDFAKVLEAAVKKREVMSPLARALEDDDQRRSFSVSINGGPLPPKHPFRVEMERQAGVIARIKDALCARGRVDDDEILDRIGRIIANE